MDYDTWMSLSTAARTDVLLAQTRYDWLRIIRKDQRTFVAIVAFEFILTSVRTRARSMSINIETSAYLQVLDLVWELLAICMDV